MGDKARGLYDKFEVRRTDGSDDPPVSGGPGVTAFPSGKHYGCDYFVLDLTHDPHALPALEAYAISCRADYPLLAADLLKKLADYAAVNGKDEF